MERPTLTPETAEDVINFLRNNPGASMTLGQLSDELGFPAEDLAAHLNDLVRRKILEQDTTSDGFDVFRFPDDYQRGSMPPT